MTLTMQQILNLPQFYAEVKSAKLPLKTAFKLSNLAKEVENKTQFYQEKFQEIVNEYGEKDADGNFVTIEATGNIKIAAGKEEECQTKIYELNTLEVELPDTKFDIEDFGNIELSLEIFNIITPFLNEQ